jgi:hypothetical protein
MRLLRECFFVLADYTEIIVAGAALALAGIAALAFFA